jgi:hypothetical protein
VSWWLLLLPVGFLELAAALCAWRRFAKKMAGM